LSPLEFVLLHFFDFSQFPTAKKSLKQKINEIIYSLIFKRNIKHTLTASPMLALMRPLASMWYRLFIFSIGA
jgi:hypothetical protein